MVLILYCHRRVAISQANNYSKGGVKLEKKETAKERYDKKTARYFSLKLNKRTDERLIEKLESVDSIQGYIKSLVQKDIEQ